MYNNRVSLRDVEEPKEKSWNQSKIATCRPTFRFVHALLFTARH